MFVAAGGRKKVGLDNSAEVKGDSGSRFVPNTARNKLPRGTKRKPLRKISCVRYAECHVLRREFFTRPFLLTHRCHIHFPVVH